MIIEEKNCLLYYAIVHFLAGHRYIELFLQSNQVGGSSGGWSNNTNDMNDTGRGGNV